MFWARPLPIEDVYYPNGFPRKEFDTEIRHYLQSIEIVARGASNIYRRRNQIDVKMRARRQLACHLRQRITTRLQLFYACRTTIWHVALNISRTGQGRYFLHDAIAKGRYFRKGTPSTRTSFLCSTLPGRWLRKARSTRQERPYFSASNAA